MSWTITDPNGSHRAIEINFVYEGGETFNVLAMSDAHRDNPKCNDELFFKHLQRAKELDAPIISVGDYFCLMQGKFDRRSNKSSIRPEHNKYNYFDRVIITETEEVAEYAQQFAVLGYGNHETAAIKNHESDPLRNFAYRLRKEHGSKVVVGGYHGYILLRFRNPDGGRVRTVKIGYHHGKWGGVISKGTQSVPRFAVAYPDCHIFLSGHTHESWHVMQSQHRLTASGNIKVNNRVHFSLGTYKEEFEEVSGFGIERIVMPKPVTGGTFLQFKTTPSGQITLCQGDNELFTID